MGLKLAAAAIAVIGALALLALPAAPAPKKKRVVVAPRGHTVFVSRDEDGRTRTKIIIQKRSYLGPGTEQFPGERSDHFYAELPHHRAAGVVDNTSAGLYNTQSALPGPFTLPFKNSPWLQY